MTAWGWWGAGQGDLCMAGDLMSQKGQQHKYHGPDPHPRPGDKCSDEKPAGEA